MISKTASIEKFKGYSLMVFGGPAKGPPRSAGSVAWQDEKKKRDMTAHRKHDRSFVSEKEKKKKVRDQSNRTPIGVPMKNTHPAKGEIVVVEGNANWRD